MPRYIKQPDQYGCGPTALMNAFKWAGYSLSFRDQKNFFYSVVQCSIPKGSSPYYLDNGFRVINQALGSPFRILRRYHVTKAEFDKRLGDGEAAVLLTGRTPSLFSTPVEVEGSTAFWGHYIFVAEKRGSIYTVVNDARTSDAKHIAVYRASNQRMRRMLQHYKDTRALERYHRKCSYPTAWFLKKLEE